MAFDYLGAKKEGYSDSEIQSYLQKSGRNFDVAGAKNEGYSDEEIHSYLQKTPGKQSNPIRQGSDVLRSIGLGAIPDILGGATFAGQKIAAGKNPLSGEGDTPDELRKMFEANPFMSPEQGKTTGGVADAGRDLAGATSWLIPAGASARTALALGATAGGLQGISQEGATPQSVATSTVTGALLGPLLQQGVKLAGAGVRKTGSLIKEEGEQIVLKGLKVNKTQLRTFREKTHQDLADFLNKEKITGNFVQEAQQRIDETQAGFDAIARTSGIKIKGNKVIAQTQETLKDLVDSTDDADLGRVEAVDKIMQNIVKKYGNNIDIGDLTKERVFYDGKVKQFGASPEVASTYQLVRDTLTDTIQKESEKAGQPGLKDLGLRLRDLKQFKKIADAQGDVGRGGNFLGLSNLVGAGIGSSVGFGTSGGDPWGALKGAAAGAVLTKTMNNPRVISAGSRLLRGTGSGIEKAGKSGAFNRQMEAMRRALRNVSASQVARPEPLP
jgi:hypothetical protein